MDDYESVSCQVVSGALGWPAPLPHVGASACSLQWLCVGALPGVHQSGSHITELSGQEWNGREKSLSFSFREPGNIHVLLFCYQSNLISTRYTNTQIVTLPCGSLSLQQWPVCWSATRGAPEWFPQLCAGPRAWGLG